MKVAVIGSRDYAWQFPDQQPSLENDYWCGCPDHASLLQLHIYDAVEKLGPEDFVVSGGATGSDYWGESAARVYRISRIIHEPHWKKYGKPAGVIRNKLIISDADVVLAFFSDRTKSRGTVGSIALAQKKGIPVYEFDALTEDRPSWYDTWYDETDGLSRI